jgi:DNA-binding MarR family transcriptional regulator
VLLARTLLAFAMEFESEWDLSLAICANVLRVLDEKGVRVRDLPLASGVSKEAIAMAMGILGKKRLAVIVPDPEGSRSKVARLTAKGVEARDEYLRRLALVEESWQRRFGKPAIRALHEALHPFAGESLFRGMEPYPEGWRASVRRPTVLPHYPMVLHRGGYPDGS